MSKMFLISESDKQNIAAYLCDAMHLVKNAALNNMLNPIIAVLGNLAEHIVETEIEKVKDKISQTEPYKKPEVVEATPVETKK